MIAICHACVRCVPFLDGPTRFFDCPPNAVQLAGSCHVVDRCHAAQVPSFRRASGRLLRRRHSGDRHAVDRRRRRRQDRLSAPARPGRAARRNRRGGAAMAAARRRWSIAKSGEPGRSIPARCGSAGATGKRRSPGSSPRPASGSASTRRSRPTSTSCLLYDTGSFFVDHRDTEKVPGMFATMVLVLPSSHRGGELVVRHLDREVTFDLRPDEPSEIGYAAFYADCVHEVRPVTAGISADPGLQSALRRQAAPAQGARLPRATGAGGGAAAALGGRGGRAGQADPAARACLYAGGAVVRCAQGRRRGRGVCAGRGGGRGGVRPPPRARVDRGERQRRARSITAGVAGAATGGR